MERIKAELNKIHDRVNKMKEFIADDHGLFTEELINDLISLDACASNIGLVIKEDF